MYQDTQLMRTEVTMITTFSTMRAHRQARFARKAAARRGGFTLVEIMVAIGIIAILLGIAIPAIIGVLKSRRVDATLSTLQTLETAIDMFAKDDPLGGGASIECPADSTIVNSSALYGDFPPTPTQRLHYVNNPSPICATTTMDPNDNENTILKFEFILEGFFDNEFASLEDPSRNQVPSKSHSSIECLIFFLRRYSTQARDIIDRMPDTVVKNTDAFVMVGNNRVYEELQIGTEAVTLDEVVDAWGRPVAYHVETGFIFDSEGNVTGSRHRWELRSAGEDEQFAPEFSPEDASDDVVVRSEWVTN